MINERRDRTVITAVSPEIEGGRFATKRIVGDKVIVRADIFADSNYELAADLLFRKEGQEEWEKVEMSVLNNDRWEGHFEVNSLGRFQYTIEAWIDHFGTWQKDFKKKYQAGTHTPVDLEIGLRLIQQALEKEESSDLRNWLEAISKAKNTEVAIPLALDNLLLSEMRNRFPNKKWITRYSKELSVLVDPPQALFSAWYECFPRSCSPQENKHGTFKDCMAWIPEIARLGFDVLYLPPIHPIGSSFRKGKDNQLNAQPEDPGSPWAIGAKEGGHTSIHPQLGSLEEFKDLLKASQEAGLQVAIDIAFQCSPDHPYLKHHPDWFSYRPDGTVQYAENPPKKYEDIVPFNFETEDWKELWKELARIVFFWIDQGVRWFRVDNPHTKPFAFWEWMINEVKQKYPETIFLSEAFTRPKVMHWLAKIGFSQSYTYFTWRYTKREIVEYMTELTKSEIADYYRPNFWPNTPDILPVNLQQGGPPAFMSRLILAATLSSNYGVYGPPFERAMSEALPGKEEYKNAEKYEIKYWDLSFTNEIKDLMQNLNRIRRENPALQKTQNLKFYPIEDDQLIYYVKFSQEGEGTLLIVVNMDPYNVHTATLMVPLEELEMNPQESYKVHELLENRHTIWEGNKISITIDPKKMPARIYRLQKALRREQGFDYFM